MRLIAAALIAVVLQANPCLQTSSGSSGGSSLNPCAHVRCGFNTVCRLLYEKRFWYSPTAVPQCLPCVPEDADDICNNNYFERALLEGNPLRPDTMKPKTCRKGSSYYSPFFFRLGRLACPQGSTCVVNGNGRQGVCCYGRLNTLASTSQLVPGPVNNSDPRCPDLCDPPCADDHTCRRCEDPDGQFVCLPKVKPGQCPQQVQSSSLWFCWLHKSSLTRGGCQDDGDCAGTKKCCQTHVCFGHSFKKCLEPDNKPPTNCPPTTTPATSSPTSSISTSSLSPSTEPPF